MNKHSKLGFDNLRGSHIQSHLILKMTSAQVVETSVTNNRAFRNNSRPENHTMQTANFAL